MKKKTRELIGWVFILVAFGLQPFQGISSKIYNWYRRHELVQWLLIIIPLWLQPIHMLAMHEMTLVHVYPIVSSEQWFFRLAHWNFWTDMGLLGIDHLEWVSIIVSTEKFIRWIKSRRQ